MRHFPLRSRRSPDRPACRRRPCARRDRLPRREWFRFRPEAACSAGIDRAFLRLARARQIDLHRRAFADFAVDLHVAAGLLDEAIDLAEAEAGALPFVLGREERLERRAPSHRGAMPTPVSLTAIITYWPASDFPMLRRIFVVEERVRHLDRELAAATAWRRAH